MGRLKTVSASTGTSAGTVTGIDGSATAKSADYTVIDTDRIRVVLVTTGAADKTITLPTASTNTNRSITIKKVDSGAGGVILSGTVDGSSSTSINKLYKQYGYCEVTSDGSSWHYTIQPTESGTLSNASGTTGTNVTGVTAVYTKFSRIGRTVTCGVQGTLAITSTNTGSGFSIAVPITTTFTQIYQGNGSFSYDTAEYKPGFFRASSTNMAAEFKSESSGSRTFYGTYVYEIQ